MNPSRGQTGIEIKAPKSPLTTPKSPLTTPPTGSDIGCTGFGCLVALFLYVGIIAFLLDDGAATPGPSQVSPIASSSVTPNIDAEPSAPQPRFARFDLRGPEEAGQASASVTFNNQRLSIKRVASLDDVPVWVRKAAKIIRRGSGDISPPHDMMPYILVGDVEVKVGALRGADDWSALMTTQLGSIDRIDAETLLRNSTFPRHEFVVSRDGRVIPVEMKPQPLVPITPVPELLGNSSFERSADPVVDPQDFLAENGYARPPPTRLVYVVGSINAVQTPELAETSRATVGILDLRVTERELREYKHAIELHRQQVDPYRDYFEYLNWSESYRNPYKLKYDPVHVEHVEPFHPAFHGVP
jgi:hypothetical protein